MSEMKSSVGTRDVEKRSNMTRDHSNTNFSARISTSRNRTSDIDNVNEVAAFVDPRTHKNLLDKTNVHLKNIRHSLAAAKECMNNLCSFMDHERRHTQGSLVTNCLDDVQPLKGNVERVSGEVLKSKNICRNGANTCKGNKEKCENLSRLCLNNSRIRELTQDATSRASFVLNANYSALDPSEGPESTHTPGEESADQESINAADPDSTHAADPELIHGAERDSIHTAETADPEFTHGAERDSIHTVETADPEFIHDAERDSIHTVETADPESVYSADKEYTKIADSENYLNSILVEDSDTLPHNQTGDDPTYDPLNSEQTVVENTDSQRKVKQNLLSTPSIIIISATPYDSTSPEEEELLDNNKDSVMESEKPSQYSKKVSFDEALVETIVFDKQDDVLENNEFDQVEFEQKTEDDTIQSPGRKSEIEDSDEYDSFIQSIKAPREISQPNFNTHVSNVLERKLECTLERASEVLEKDASSEIKEYIQARLDLIETENSEKDKETGSSVTTDSEYEQHHRYTSDTSAINVRFQSQGSVATSLTEGKSLTQVLKTIDTIIYKNGVAMIWKKLDYSDKEVLIPVPPNSISSEYENLTQKTTTEKEKTDKPQKEPFELIVKRVLGLADYNIMMGKPKAQAPKTKIPGIDWSRQIQLKRQAQQPHILYKDQWKQNKIMSKIIGPGSYEFKDFIQLANEKPGSDKGICNSLGPRFDKTLQSSTPGPGTYGIGGVPQSALEEKSRKSFSTKGMLDTGNRKRNLPYVGSHLPPGTYNFKSFTEVMLENIEATKKRQKNIPDEPNLEYTAGYFSTHKRPLIGPGRYKYNTFIDELSNTNCHTRGRFSKVAQFPEVPTERVIVFSQTHHPPLKDSPGPATYNIKEFSKFKTVNTPGFLSSSQRDDKLAQKFFTGSSIPVGPGRYNITKCEDLNNINGHTSVFKSKTEKPNLRVSQYLQSRIQPRDVGNQASGCQAKNTNYSIITM